MLALIGVNNIISCGYDASLTSGSSWLTISWLSTGDCRLRNETNRIALLTRITADRKNRYCEQVSNNTSPNISTILWRRTSLNWLIYDSLLNSLYSFDAIADTSQTVFIKAPVSCSLYSFVPSIMYLLKCQTVRYVHLLQSFSPSEGYPTVNLSDVSLRKDSRRYPKGWFDLTTYILATIRQH